MIERFNLLLAGVGGQGTLVAGKLLSDVALQLGLDTRVSEVHGMAQRGGSVTTAVRIAPQVHSPVIEPGEADFILSFEELEALRWASHLKVGGVMIMNQNRVMPVTVSMGQAQYPEAVEQTLRQAELGSTRVFSIDATGLAQQAGSVKADNFGMPGAMPQLLDIPERVFLQAIEHVLPQKLHAINIQAFELGSGIMKATQTD